MRHYNIYLCEYKLLGHTSRSRVDPWQSHEFLACQFLIITQLWMITWRSEKFDLWLWRSNWHLKLRLTSETFFMHTQATNTLTGQNTAKLYDGLLRKKFANYFFFPKLSTNAIMCLSELYKKKVLARGSRVDTPACQFIIITQLWLSVGHKSVNCGF